METHLKYKHTKFSILLTIFGLLFNFVFGVIIVLQGISVEESLLKNI